MPTMESTAKNNVFKVFRIAVFSNINYHLHFAYKSKIFMKT